MENQQMVSTDGIVLSVEKLSKQYRGMVAVDDISFSIPAGSLTVILGPAGAGKTTTLRMIAGLEYPDKGRILLSGADSSGLEPKDRDIAMIFDNLALYPDKTGFENIANPLKIRKFPKEEQEKQVAKVAHTLQISH
ncbi:MAG: ATP-binding cassette domain-containing protein, partial [Proteobacteria bacterium]|nr:ATP-binding cassette domain-containing protein [Pseudomonadota bacterium]